MPDRPPASIEPRTRAKLLRDLASLNRLFESLRDRLSTPPEETPTIERMRRTIASQQLRLERLEHEASAILAEITRLEDEVHGREQALALLLGHVVGRLERIHEDAWSPVPITGFRLWAMRSGGLVGPRTRWTKPEFTASCAAHGLGAPHADERCGRLGCGVYATKELAPLLDMHVQAESHSYVAAAVALSGRVVEHERGYRAAAATVTAAYAVWPDRTMATTEAERLGALFAACDRIPSTWCEARSQASPLHDLTDFLTNYAEEETTWISAIRSA